MPRVTAVEGGSVGRILVPPHLPCHAPLLTRDNPHSRQKFRVIYEAFATSTITGHRSETVGAFTVNTVIESYEFEGEFPPHWLGNLAAHLASDGLDVDSVDAKLGDGGMWKVALTISGQAPPSQRELLALLRLHYQNNSLLRGTLTRYRLLRDSSCLFLALGAQDQTGFLAQLCADLAAHALFPVRVEARCEGGQIDDSFWLKGIAHSVPHPETEATLRRFLSAWQAGTLRSSIRPPRPIL